MFYIIRCLILHRVFQISTGLSDILMFWSELYCLIMKPLHFLMRYSGFISSLKSVHLFSFEKQKRNRETLLHSSSFSFLDLKLLSVIDILCFACFPSLRSRWIRSNTDGAVSVLVPSVCRTPPPPPAGLKGQNELWEFIMSSVCGGNIHLTDKLVQVRFKRRQKEQHKHFSLRKQVWEERSRS